MTKLLDEAIAKVRTLPDAEQDRAAEALLAAFTPDADDYTLTPEQAEEVRRIRAGLATGETSIATADEVATLWRDLGL
jgi:hypothetical protein